MAVVDEEETQFKYTPVAGPKFPGILSSIFTTPLSYPTQGNPVDLTKHGEYRKRYVSGMHPEWSRFWASRPGSTHTGINIYAPVGTFVVALCPGEVEMVAGIDANIGRRAWLRFTALCRFQWNLTVISDGRSSQGIEVRQARAGCPASA
jgi:murein DD-endopeptidase MepM/ murein hydrolase activator NlpD